MHDYLGAYVLGALEPEESEQLQAHLAECPACHSEVAEIAWIPALLPLVPPDHIDDLEERDGADVIDIASRPSPAMLDRLLAATHREQRRHARGFRRKAVMVAAAALAAGGTALGVVGTEHSASARTLHAADQGTGVSATVTVSARSWGTQLGLSLQGVYPGGTCSLVAYSRDGHHEIAATWVASRQGTAEVPGATAIPARQLRELDVVAAEGSQLVQIVVPKTGN